MPATADNRIRIVDEQLLDGALNELNARIRSQHRLRRHPVNVAVGLRTGPAHRRPLAFIEHPKMDTGLVDQLAHQAVERVDLADEMALTNASNGRIARHLANGVQPLADEQSARSAPRCCGHRLSARMTAANHNNRGCAWARTGRETVGPRNEKDEAERTPAALHRAAAGAPCSKGPKEHLHLVVDRLPRREMGAVRSWRA